MKSSTINVSHVLTIAERIDKAIAYVRSHSTIIRHTIGGVFFTIGFALCTGVDENLVQALYALAFIFGAYVCFNDGGVKE